MSVTSLEGFVDSEGVDVIQEGGMTHFLTESGMQACDVTRVTRENETLFSLETSCGQGTLELVDHDHDEVAAGRRRLCHDKGVSNCAQYVPSSYAVSTPALHLLLLLVDEFIFMFDFSKITLMFCTLGKSGSRRV